MREALKSGGLNEAIVSMSDSETKFVILTLTLILYYCHLWGYM